MPSPQTPAPAPPGTETAWLEPDDEELPRRPRRRLLGSGGNPSALALLGVLLCACGFIGGVLVEKGQSSSSATAGSGTRLGARVAALEGGGRSSSGAGASGGAGGLLGGGARPTVGTVAYVSGHTLYVANAEGDTVKVDTSASTRVSKTVGSSVHAVHPGETVTVIGSSGSDGAIGAESISVGSGSGLAGLFGSRRPQGGATGSGRSGEPTLFGGG